MGRRKEAKNPPKINLQLPKGYKVVQGDGFAKSFFFEKKGDTIEGRVLSVKEIKYQKKKRLICTVENKKGTFAVWDSAALRALFETAKKGDEVFIRFEGLASTHKKGQNPAKLFTTGIK